jgi:pSer/pThr/pTyr-binding forkhead associated (FHA) protein
MELGRYRVGRRKLTLGRAPDNDIVLDHHGVSRYHAQVITVQGESIVEDLDSRNGTFVNNALVKVRALRRDDDIVIAGYRLRVSLDPEAADTSASGGPPDVAALLRRWRRGGAPAREALTSNVSARCSRCGAVVDA